MNGRAKELKAQGYKKVVLAGHSWGAWVAMVAAQDPQCAADALLLSAPNTFGPRLSQIAGKQEEHIRGGYSRRPSEKKTARLNPNFSKVLTEFGPALNGVKTPTVLILPDDTDWDPDPGARGEIAKKHFTDVNVPHLIIAKPPGFSGHLAAWLPVFDYGYGKCVQSFLENPRSGACRAVPLTRFDFRSIVSISQMAALDKRLVSADTLAGKKFAAYTMSDLANKYYRYTAPGKRMVTEGGGERPQDVTFHDGLHCADKTCSRLVRWSDGYILEFDPKTGDLDAWWVEDK